MKPKADEAMKAKTLAMKAFSGWRCMRAATREACKAAKLASTDAKAMAYAKAHGLGYWEDGIWRNPVKDIHPLVNICIPYYFLKIKLSLSRQLQSI